MTSQSPAVAAVAMASRAIAGGGPAELVLPASPQAQQPYLEHPRTLHLAALLLPRPEPYTHTSMPFQTLRTCSEVPEPPRVCSTHDRVSISTADPGPLVSSRPSGGLWAAGRREQPQESPSQQHGETQVPAVGGRPGPLRASGQNPHFRSTCSHWHWRDVSHRALLSLESKRLMLKNDPSEFVFQNNLE